MSKYIPKTEQEIEKDIDLLMTIPENQRTFHERNPITNMEVDSNLRLYGLQYLDKLFRSELNKSMNNKKLD